MGDVSAIGMMEGTYFVGRRELVQWLSSNFALSVTKVEDCKSGAIYLQIMDKIYQDNVVPMSKINWGSNQEYQYVKHYKLLQEVFEACQIKKVIEVDRLIKGSYQENLEFLQWMKTVHDRLYDGQPYNPVARRKLGICANAPAWFYPPKNAVIDTSHKENERFPKKVAEARNHAPPRPGVVKKVPQNSKALEDLRMELEEALAEKDFFFNKLRALEILCEEKTTSGQADVPVADVERILFAVEEQAIAE
eukprot:GHVP01054026.1.p1 GENE.GHVP01054026.1~~GHVP01054026.1.p1  ORF type:complete len:258 (+),score=48.64 GHVP01054026.1:29-775(+)